MTRLTALWAQRQMLACDQAKPLPGCLPRTLLDQVLDLALPAVPRESYRVSTRHDWQVGLAVQNW